MKIASTKRGVFLFNGNTKSERIKKAFKRENSLFEEVITQKGRVKGNTDIERYHNRIKEAEKLEASPTHKVRVSK